MSDTNWDDLSPTPPLPQPPDPDSSDPTGDAIVAKMNAASQAGASDDEVMQQEVADFGRVGRKATATVDHSEKKSAWDELSPTPPEKLSGDSVLDAQRLGYTPTQNFGGDVYNSPSAELRKKDEFKAPPESASDYIKALGTAARSRLGESAAGGLRAAGEAAQTYLHNVTEPFKELTGLSDSPVEDVAQGAADVGSKQFGKYASEEEKARGNLISDPHGLGENLAYIGQETAINAPTLAAAVAAGPAGGGALFGGTTAGAKYGQARAEGESPAVAAQAAIQEGTIAGITQDLTLGRALNPATMSALHRIGSATGTNIAGSVLSEAANIDTEIHTEGKQLTRAEIADRLAKAAESATVVGMGLGAAGVAMHPADAKALSAQRVNDATSQLIRNNADAGQVSQDQAGISGQGAEPQVSGTDSGENVQQPTQTGASPDHTEDQVNVDQNIQPTSPVSAAEEKAKAFTPDERHVEKVEKLLNDTPGLSDEQKASIRQGITAPAKDPLTGYDLRPELAPTIDAAIKAGEPAAYVEMDIKKLHALNNASGSEEAADVHMKAMTDMARTELENAGGTVVPFKKGGDEFGYVVRGLDAGAAHDAMTEADAKVNEYVKANKLDALPNNRTGENESTGIHFAAADIKPSDTTSHVMRTADELVTARKRGVGYERPGTTETTGTGQDTGSGDSASTAAHDGENAGRASNDGNTLPGEAENAYRLGTQAQGVTEPEARQVLSKEFGATAVRKMEAAGLKLSPSSDLPRLSPELSPLQHSEVKALTTKQGQPHIIHDQAPASDIPRLAVHEIWHANADRILPQTKQEQLARTVDQVARTSPKVAEGLAKIPSDTPKSQVAQEKVAYALEHVHDPSLSAKILDPIKIGLNRLGVPKNWLDANEALLRRIGSENLKHFAETPRTYQTEGTERQPAPKIKPRVRVPVDQVPVNRVALEDNNSATTVAPQDNAVGIKNAAKAQERATRGLEPEISSLRPDEKAVWDAAAKQRAEDPLAGYRLSDELAAKPRQTSPQETALLIQHGAELNNRYDDVLSKIDDAQKSGDKNTEINANQDRQTLEQQLATHDKASKEAGTEWSAAGRMRQKLAERDYSMGRQLGKFRAIEGGELPATLRKHVEASVKRIGDLQKSLDAARAENEQLRQPKAQRRTPLQKKQLDDDFAQMAKRAIALRKPVRETGTTYARVADPELSTVIRKMARNRSDAGETDPAKILDAIHKAMDGVVPKQDIADTITSNTPYRKGTKSELQQRYDDIRHALNDPAVKKDAAAQKRLVNKLADLKSRIQRKDFDPPQKKPKTEKSEAVQKLEVAVAREQKRLNQLAEQRARLTDTPIGKTLRLFHDARLFDILSSVLVFKKLVSAAITRNAMQMGEEALGAAAARIPGISKYAQWSPRYHGRDFWRGEIEAGKGYGGAVVRAGEDAMHGQNKWDALYGNKHLSGEYTDFGGQLSGALKSPGMVNKTTETVHAVASLPGRSHAMIKEFVSEPEMNRARFKIATYMRTKLHAKGYTPEQVEEHMGRDSTRATIDAAAYQHALESKFQGKNFITDSINSTLTRWEKDGTLGKLGAFGFKSEYPIRGIPMNIAKELLTSYPFGAVKAALKTRGFDKLSDGDKEKAADYIMKNIRKQGMGAVILATGMAMKSYLGGVPGAEKKRKDIKPGEAAIGGMSFGTQIMHGPGPELLEMGASLMRIYEAEHGKNHNSFVSAMSALAQVYPTLALQSIPYTDQPRRQINTYEWAQKDGRPGMDAVLGDMIRSGTIPAFVQQYARAVDPYQGYRKPMNIGQDIETGIPGHGIPGIIPGREDVPKQPQR